MIKTSLAKPRCAVRVDGLYCGVVDAMNQRTEPSNGGTDGSEPSLLYSVV